MGDEHVERLLRSKREAIQDFLVEAIRCAVPCKPDSEGRGATNIQQLVAAKLRDIGMVPTIWYPPVNSIREKYRTMGYDLDYENRPNVTATWRGDGSGRSLVLNCHADVGAPEGVHGWSSDPFAARVVGDRVYGRGSCDAKGPLTAVLFALEALRESGFQPGGDIYFQSVADQIGGGNGTLACIEAGHVGDAVIVAQPTSLRVCSGSRGFAFLTIRVSGRAAHAGSPGEGVNAVSSAVRYIRALEQLQVRLDGERTHHLWDSVKVKHPMTVTAIRGGGFGGVVPDECEIRVNAGCIGGETLEDLQKWVEEALAEASADDPWLRENPPEIVWGPVRVEPSVSDPNHEIARLLAESADGAGTFAPAALTAVSDLRFFTNVAETQGVIFGPGDPSRVYLPDEYVSVGDVISAALSLCRTISRWSRT